MQFQPVTVQRRRKRTWAPAIGDITALSRSARQLAHISASRISRPEVAACLEKYRFATAVERACKLIRADLILELIDGHGLRAIDIARVTGERPGDISQMHSVATTFPRNARAADVTYNHLLLATRMVRKFPALRMTAAEALAVIQSARLTQHRDVTRHFSLMERSATAGTAGRLLDLPLVPYFDRAYHGRFQDLLSSFPDRSIQILAIDPPYVYGDETYSSRGARSRDCDSDDPVSAVGLVTDLLHEWQPKLAPGGVALLWQPWQALLPEIGSAVQAYGWSIVGPVVWDKGRPQPGNFLSPYSVQGELLWILHRPGDKLFNHAGGSREMILRFSPVSFPSLAHSQVHGFEKPQGLCEWLVRKHSRPGDLVFDACGCTASMSVAAINSGRRFVYAESNRDNFELGQSRISARLSQISTAVS